MSGSPLTAGTQAAMGQQGPGHMVRTGLASTTGHLPGSAPLGTELQREMLVGSTIGRRGTTAGLASLTGLCSTAGRMTEAQAMSVTGPQVLPKEASGLLIGTGMLVLVPASGQAPAGTGLAAMAAASGMALGRTGTVRLVAPTGLAQKGRVAAAATSALPQTESGALLATGLGQTGMLAGALPTGKVMAGAPGQVVTLGLLIRATGQTGLTGLVQIPLSGPMMTGLMGRAPAPGMARRAEGSSTSSRAGSTMMAGSQVSCLGGSWPCCSCAASCMLRMPWTLHIYRDKHVAQLQ